MTAAELLSEKRKLRQVMRVRLREVSSLDRRRAGVAIAERLVASRVWSATSCVVAFDSRPDEVDSGPFIEIALAAGKRLALPRTTETGGLEFVAVCGLGDLRVGRFGIREPLPDGPLSSLDEATLVLVPGIAFDRQGGRLGRGRGYYDRALAHLPHREPRPLLVGIGYSFQIIEHVPMTALDARLDGVVSEAGLFECEASRGRWARYGP